MVGRAKAGDGKAVKMRDSCLPITRDSQVPVAAIDGFRSTPESKKGEERAQVTRVTDAGDFNGLTILYAA